MTDEQTLGTVLITLAGSTFLVGLLIVLVGECLLFAPAWCTSLLTSATLHAVHGCINAA